MSQNKEKKLENLHLSTKLYKSKFRTVLKTENRIDLCACLC